MNIFLKSLIIGFSIAAPVGPIGILCINRTLNRGFISGMFTGLGAATADALYGCIIGFGLTAISSYLISHEMIIHIIGGLILCYLGVKILLSKSTSTTAKQKTSGGYFSSFILTLTNPMTIITFAAIFSGLGVGTTNPNISHALMVISGIFFGSLIWWLTLSATVIIIHHRISMNITKWINILSGVLIFGFGIWIIISGVIN